MKFGQSVRTFTASILAACLAVPAHAAGNRPPREENDQPVFISLTRTPMKADELPTNTTVLESEEIEKRGFRNVGDAVATLPGVTEIKSGSLGLTRLPGIRGFFNKQIRVVLDDQPLPTDLTGNVDLSQIPADIVDRIELVRGGSSFAYGANAEGGVIHIRTKRARAATPSTSLQSEYGSYNTQVHRLGAGGKAGRTDGFFTVSRNLSNGFQQNSDFRNLSFSAQGGYDFGRAGRTSLYGFLSNSEVGVPSGTPVAIGSFNGEAERAANNTTARQMDRTQMFRAEHRAPVGPGSATVRLNADDTRRYFTSPQTAFEDQNEVASRGLALLGEGPLGLSGGFEYQRQFLDSRSNGKHDTALWAVFLQEEARVIENLTAIFGYRHDQSKEFGGSENPRFTVVWRPSERLKLSSNVSRSFQAPTFADLFSPFAPPDPNLKPETSWHYDAGVEAKPCESLTFRATGFRADTDNRIALDPARGFAAFNLTRAHGTGVETEIAHTAGPVSQSLNYTFLDNEGQAVGSTEFQLLQFSPHHTLNHALGADLPAGVGIRSTVRYVSEQFSAINKGGVRLPPFATWGLRLSKKIGRLAGFEGELYFEVENLLNKHYAENGDAFNGLFPQPGRTFHGGVQLKVWG